MDFLVRSLALRGSGGFLNTTTSANSTAFNVSHPSTSIANSTSPITLNPTTTANPYFNGTDLNNATQCWPAYWSYSSMLESWSTAHRTIKTHTFTKTLTIKTAVPSPSANSTYSVLCDGVPRFGYEADAKNASVELPTPVTTTTFSTSHEYIWKSSNFPPAPSCGIANQDECSVAWGLFGSSLQSSLTAWTSSNVLTISLASPPTAVIVNDKATPLTAAPGALPTLQLHGEDYTAEYGTYSISNAVNLYGETILTPGGQQILSWNTDLVTKPFGPSNENCPRPTGNTISSQCATAQCTIRGKYVDLMYFPPPSTSRDLCANTSPGFNSYSISIYSHPHSSTVINTTTFWYDKAYVRYEAVSAYKYCDLDNQLGRTSVPVGGTYTSHLIEVSSSDISSICDYRYNTGRPMGLVIGATAKPFNFEDLVGDIPLSAYNCIPRCQSGCQSIITDWYVPGLAVPPQVRAQDPEWASCVPVFDGTPDPPIALSSVPGFLESTTTTDPPKQTEPATPGQTIPPVSPKPTHVDDPPPPAPPVTVPFTQTIGLPPQVNPAPTHKTSAAGPVAVNPKPVFTQPLPITTIGNSIINIDPSHPGTIVIADPQHPGAARTVTAGGAPISVGGTTISVDPSTGGVIISGSSTLIPIGTVNGKPVYVDSSQPGVVIIGDPRSGEATQTMNANGPAVVIDGTTLSLAPAATSLSSPSTTTVSGLQLQMLPDGTLLINNAHYLRPGDPQTSINGHTIFVDPSGTVVVDGKPVTMSPSGPDATGELVIVGPDGITTTLNIASATERASVFAEEANETANDATARETGKESGTGSQTADDFLSSVTKTALSGSSTAESAPQSSSTSGGLRLVPARSVVWYGALLLVCLTI